MGRVAGADLMWSIPVSCSQSTDITSRTLTSQMFIGALTASSHGNVTQLRAPDSGSQSTVFLVTYNMHTMHTNAYVEHNYTFKGLDKTCCILAFYV
jgi:hypothetical protein